MSENPSTIDILLEWKHKLDLVANDGTTLVSCKVLQNLLDYTISLEKFRIQYEIQLAANLSHNSESSDG